MRKHKKKTFALWKEKIPQVFHKRSRSGDLAARLAAPKSFIDKETRTTSPLPHEFATTGNRERKFAKAKKENLSKIRGRELDLEYEEERKKERRREWRREERIRDFSPQRNRVTSIFWEKATPGSFPIQRQHPQFEKTPSWKKVPKFLFLSLSERWCQDYLNNSQMR